MGSGNRVTMLCLQVSSSTGSAASSQVDEQSAKLPPHHWLAGHQTTDASDWLNWNTADASDWLAYITHGAIHKFTWIYYKLDMQLHSVTDSFCFCLFGLLPWPCYLKDSLGKPLDGFTTFFYQLTNSVEAAQKLNVMIWCHFSLERLFQGPNLSCSRWFEQ